MTPTVQVAHDFLGILDVLCGLFLVWATQRTTNDANIYTSVGKWAWWRRIVYSAMSIAVFGLGVKRFFNDTNDIFYVIFQSILLLGFCNFIALRAFGFITQDVFTNGSRQRR